MAVDEGVLVKTGLDVLVSVRNAIAGTDLGQLHEAVDREFLTLDQQEQSVRSVMAKMESDFSVAWGNFTMNEDRTRPPKAGKFAGGRQGRPQARGRVSPLRASGLAWA